MKVPKIFALASLVCFLPAFTPSPGVNHFSVKYSEVSSTSNLDWIKQVSRQYSPDSWNLLMNYEKLPANQEARLSDGSVISSQKPVKTFHYLKGKSKIDLLLSMSTNVHEISHAYFRVNAFEYAKEKGIQLNWDNAEGFIYMSPTSSYFISVPRKILFPSSKLLTTIPSKMKTFRYETYIKGNTSTQSEGVIGLLNELHAYYLGTKYTFQMLDAYKIAEGDVKGFYYWVSHLQSIVSAYYEFDFFIKEYLLYMKTKHPENYSFLKSDKQFLKAYSSIESSFRRLITDYEKTISLQIQILHKPGKAEVTIEDDILWVWLQGNKTKSGTTIFSEDKAKIEAILKTNRYGILDNDLIKS